MDFRFTERQEMLRSALRELVKRHCPREYVRECDELRKPPWESYKALADGGWFGLGIPEEYGGMGGDAIELAILLEEVGKGHLDLALWAFRVVCYGGVAILEDGAEEQRSFFLPQVAKGDCIFCFGLTEPEAGSDAAAITTTAVADGDHFIINGQKCFTSGFDISHYALLATRTDKTVKKHKGITNFIVDCKSPGINSQKIECLGHRSVPTSRLYLDNVRVPRERMLGGLNEGWEGILKYLTFERLCLSAARTGAAEAALEDAVEYAKERKQFGRPIGSFQAVSHKLADMKMMVEVSRILVYRFGWLVKEGLSGLMEAAILKLYTAEAYKTVADLGLQVMGGYGYAMEYDMQRHFRDSRLGTIGGGTSEIQRNIIARVLGLG